jgi:transcription initiation factor TFIID subunit TAF12
MVLIGFTVRRIGGAVMRSKALPAVSLLGVFLAGMSVGLAQQPSPPAPPQPQQQQQQQKKAQQTPSGQAGKEESSAHSATTKPQDNAVLVNGRLAAPGAPDNTDTTPAKFSDTNAADDRLSTFAYTFKLLSAEQRRAVYEGLKDQQSAVELEAEIATELPFAVELRSVPETLVSRVPDTKGYEYVVTHGRVLVVSPTRIVVGTFSDVEGNAGR